MKQGDLIARSASGPALRSALRDRHRLAAASYAPWLLVWGAERAVNAGLRFAEPWREAGRLPAGLFLAALLVSLGLLLWEKLRRRAPAGVPAPLLPATLVRSLAVVLGLSALYLAVSRMSLWGLTPYDSALLPGFLLASAYLVLGRRLGWPLTVLGVWMLALTAVTAWKYLGFAPILVSGLGGLSLMAVAGLLRLWTRGMRYQ
ncbi:hypothetical protein [Paenibacillus mucilaginosus]|uniref:Uncharacterized protein n=1 Tax=Paenibacillus mucilaginosus (strain KNP414) TaxID=1036673 RepID=F8FQ08_PAEMK|nr:hypothetical protein [Paenibacillus mucilaginosus]AEI39150.1 hypothetical protein KNP414_00525 [Paenibacillus mucilaginosus KNP414]MCG7217262.1 hypothetical protein [Paenibacillus mucilaginosus]WDM28166.1 hypothetical protein KCX80_02485 [Paenibacillus mucilaginosus]